MIKLDRFFENHLANREISSEELRQFAEDHIGKLKGMSALPVQITALLAPTEAAFGAFDAALSARTTLQATQSGGTINKDDALQLFRTIVRQREGRVRDKFAKGSGSYTEFFPQGLKEYNKARLGQIPGLLERLITATNKHKTELGPELLAEFIALKTTFSAAREGQVEAKGELANARARVATTRTALEHQIGKNILAIASHHLGDRERAADYFNQSLLEDPARTNDESTPAQTP